MYLYDHVIICSAPLLCVFFFFNDTATTEIYTLPLHDALPIFSPPLRRYIVQNDVMRNDLVRYHGIDNDRIVVTGWPQTDVFHRKRPRAEYERVVGGLGLEPSHPVVLVMGNTPTNAPSEKRFVERLV